MFGFIGRKLTEKNLVHAERVLTEANVSGRASSLATYFDPQIDAILRRASLMQPEEVLAISHKFMATYNKSRGVADENARAMLELAGQYLYLVGTRASLEGTTKYSEMRLGHTALGLIIEYDKALSLIRAAMRPQ